MFHHIKSVRLTDHKGKSRISPKRLSEFCCFLETSLQKYRDPDMSLSNSETSLKKGAVEMFQKQNSLNNIKNCYIAGIFPATACPFIG